MPIKPALRPTMSICHRYIRAQRHSAPRLLVACRQYSSSSDRSSTHAENETQHTSSSKAAKAEDASEPEKGPMARRLEEATEEALLTGGTAGRRAVEEAGFSEELKDKLLGKVQSAKFRDKYAHAFAQAGLSSEQSSSSSAARDASEPWSGTETQPDAVLRMLNDARKPLKPELRGKYHIPQPIDLRPSRDPKIHPSQRAANARERAGAYADMISNEEKGVGTGSYASSKGLSEEEREAFRREFRERFTPSARAVPATVSGIAAIANERIENAISRGQFKNIPRGKDAASRDGRADNPFIDTTEYLMNSMLKRQEITPPWIEKQQELSQAANVFRSRLRNDWRRHAARMIAAAGGGLEEHVRRAEGYARAEARVNPHGRMAVSGVVPGASTDDVVMVKMRRSAAQVDPAPLPEDDAAATAETASPGATSDPAMDTYAAFPFRDPDWEAAERAYLTLSVENLNSITRSYNLMAPELAKKPYFSLERELKACYAEMAPLVADTIRERATRPARSLLEGQGASIQQNTIFDRFGNEGTTTTRIHDNKAPHYGFKEMWRDIWG